jgi:hypothetical protein
MESLWRSRDEGKTFLNFNAVSDLNYLHKAPRGVGISSDNHKNHN